MNSVFHYICHNIGVGLFDDFTNRIAYCYGSIKKCLVNLCGWYLKRFGKTGAWVSSSCNHGCSVDNSGILPAQGQMDFRWRSIRSKSYLQLLLFFAQIKSISSPSFLFFLSAAVTVHYSVQQRSHKTSPLSNEGVNKNQRRIVKKQFFAGFLGTWGCHRRIYQQVCTKEA